MIAPLLWLLYVVMPIEGWGLLNGRPLGAIEALALLSLVWLWWIRRSVPFTVLAVVALIAKVAIGGWLIAPRGFEARYYANPTFTAPVERGVEPADPGFTRTDRRLSFGRPGDPHLPVHFLNDIARFNFYLPTQPARESLPVSVTWEGWIHAPRAATKRLYVRFASGQATVTIGDAATQTIAASKLTSGDAWTGYAPLRAGFEHIVITLAIPQGGDRTFDAGWLVNGEERPFDDTMVFRRQVTDARMRIDGVVRWISTTFDALLLAALLIGVLRALASACRRLTIAPAVRDGLALLSALAIADALLFARPVLHAMVTLSGGDDWLSYETMARDIGLHGLWMTRGAVLGQGQPFYFQPLYAYFVAALHWIFGDGLYGIYLVQRLLVGGTVIALWRTTATLFGERVGGAGFVVAAVFVFEKVAPWSGFLLTELLFVPLACVWTWQLVRLARRPVPTIADATAAGIVGGLAVLARSTLMLAWPIALPLTGIALWRTKRAGRIVFLLAATLVAVTSLATYRNWVVSKQAVMIASSGSINFYLGNQPPMKIVIPSDHKAQYTRYGIDENVQTSIEYGRQHPREFFDGWRKKAIYALGWFGDLAPEMGRSDFFIATGMIALVGLVIWMRGPTWLPPAGVAGLIPLGIALAQFVVLVIVFPTAGDRLVLPFYALLTPYVAIAAMAALHLIPSFGRRTVATVVLLVAAGLASGCSSPKPPERDLALAKTKLDAANASAAVGLAPDALRAAQLAQYELDAELARQSTRWFKSYDLADDLAIAVQAASDAAVAQANAAREETIAAANAGTEDRRGPNLFQNGDFVSGLKEWSLHPDSDTTVTVDPVGVNERAWHARYRKGNWSVIYQEFPLQPDTVYVYEAWVKTTAPIVALYWQSDIGRYHEIDHAYPEWKHLRYVFITPHWEGKPYRTGFNPVLMKGAGEAWLRDLRLSVFQPKASR